MSCLSCCVKGCQYRGKRRVPFNVSLFTLPANAPDILKRAWREVCVGRIIACSEHFAEDDYTVRKRPPAPGKPPTLVKTLRHNVVPKRFISRGEKVPDKNSNKEKEEESENCKIEEELPKDPLALDEDEIVAPPPEDTVVMISEDESEMEERPKECPGQEKTITISQKKLVKIPGILPSNSRKVNTKPGSTIVVQAQKKSTPPPPSLTTIAKPGPSQEKKKPPEKSPETISLDSDDEDKSPSIPPPPPPPAVLKTPPPLKPLPPPPRPIKYDKVLLKGTLKVNVNCPLQVKSVESLKSGLKYLVKPRAPVEAPKVPQEKKKSPEKQDPKIINMARQKLGESLINQSQRNFLEKIMIMRGLKINKDDAPVKLVKLQDYLSGKGLSVKKIMPKRKNEDKSVPEEPRDPKVRKEDSPSPLKITSVRSLSAPQVLNQYLRKQRKQDVTVKVNSTANASFTVQVNPESMQESEEEASSSASTSSQQSVKQVLFEEVPLENALRELNTSQTNVQQEPAASQSQSSSQNTEDDDVILLPQKIDVIAVDSDDEESSPPTAKTDCNLPDCPNLQQFRESLEKNRQLLNMRKKLMEQRQILETALAKKTAKHKATQDFLNKIPTILSQNQRDLFLGTKSKVVWHQKEIQDALVMKHLSEEFYCYLRDKLRYPLPSMTSLEKWEREYVLQARYVKEFAIDYQHNQNEDMDED